MITLRLETIEWDGKSDTARGTGLSEDGKLVAFTMDWRPASDYAIALEEKGPGVIVVEVAQAQITGFGEAE